MNSINMMSPAKLGNIDVIFANYADVAPAYYFPLRAPHVVVISTDCLVVDSPPIATTDPLTFALISIVNFTTVLSGNPLQLLIAACRAELICVLDGLSPALMEAFISCGPPSSGLVPAQKQLK
ncbi:MAG: hypothetical protein JSR50_03140 [Proteobacteria bacterium]|nr:hypothetical protein [Pseudomonadota bacterium]